MFFLLTRTTDWEKGDEGDGEREISKIKIMY